MSRETGEENAVGKIGSALGKGLVAGLVGTVAITAFQLIEIKAGLYKESSAPADAASKVLDVKPENAAAQEKFSNLVHWGYGTGWGAVRGLLALAGAQGPLATLIHFAAISGTATVMLTDLKLAPPVQEQSAKDVALETFNHLVYAVVAGLVFDALTNEEDSFTA